MPQEIFNGQEIEENKARLKALIELINSRNAVLFMGAGCSIQLEYPSWPGLLGELEGLTGADFIRDATKKTNSPLEYADAIKNNIIACNGGPDKYHNKLATIFGPKSKPYDSLHQMLVSLSFKGIVTTNYDPAIEAALGAKNTGVHYNALQIQEDTKCFISQFFLSLDFDKFPKHILHLHGIYTNPKEIILTLEEYKRAYGFIVPPQDTGGFKEPKEVVWSLHRRVLWALLATRRLVFIGFSLDDPYLEHLVGLSANDLWRWDSPVHFAIIPISLENSDRAKRRAEFFRKERGIETYFYIDHDGKHTELHKTISEIANACGIQPSDWIEAWNKKFGGS